MAARSENEGTSDGETYIEKYTRGVLQVENILSLERLRQASHCEIWEPEDEITSHHPGWTKMNLLIRHLLSKAIREGKLE